MSERRWWKWVPPHRVPRDLLLRGSVENVAMTPREQDFFGTEAELAARVAEANRSPVRCETTGRLFASHQEHREWHARVRA